MGDSLKGKVAVVTGSGQGIGRAIAIGLAQEGAAVVTNNRKKGSTDITPFGEAFEKSMSKEEKEYAAKLGGDAETTADEIRKMGGKAVPFFGDVGDFLVARKLIQTAVDNFAKIDILVNNAGVFRSASPWEMTEEDWDYITSNKPKSCFNCTRHALPLMMKQRWGRIINCTSIARLGQSNNANYSAANAGVVGFTRSVANDVYKYGITCNAYAPIAWTRAAHSLEILINRLAKADTPIADADTLKKEGSGLEQIAGRPEPLAPFIAYLATDAAADISGTVFSVHGGRISRYSDPEEVTTLDKKEGLWTVDELTQQVPEVLLKGYVSPTKRLWDGLPYLMVK